MKGRSFERDRVASRTRRGRTSPPTQSAVQAAKIKVCSAPSNDGAEQASCLAWAPTLCVSAKGGTSERKYGGCTGLGRGLRHSRPVDSRCDDREVVQSDSSLAAGVCNHGLTPATGFVSARARGELAKSGRVQQSTKHHTRCNAASTPGQIPHRAGTAMRGHGRVSRPCLTAAAMLTPSATIRPHLCAWGKHQRGGKWESGAGSAAA